MTTVLLDTTRDNVSSAAIRKTFEAVQILTESKVNPITVDHIVNVLGVDLPDPKWAGRSVSSLSHCIPPVLIAERTNGKKLGPIANIRLANSNPLPKEIQIQTDPNLKRVHLNSKKAKAEAERAAKQAALKAEAGKLPLPSIITALSSLTRRELMLLIIQAQQQLKETQA